MRRRLTLLCILLLVGTLSTSTHSAPPRPANSATVRFIWNAPPERPVGDLLPFTVETFGGTARYMTITVEPDFPTTYLFHSIEPLAYTTYECHVDGNQLICPNVIVGDGFPHATVRGFLQIGSGIATRPQTVTTTLRSITWHDRFTTTAVLTPTWSPTFLPVIGGS